MIINRKNISILLENLFRKNNKNICSIKLLDATSKMTACLNQEVHLSIGHNSSLTTEDDWSTCKNYGKCFLGIIFLDWASLNLPYFTIFVRIKKYCFFFIILEVRGVVPFIILCEIYLSYWTQLLSINVMFESNSIYIHIFSEFLRLFFCMGFFSGRTFTNMT